MSEENENPEESTQEESLIDDVLTEEHTEQTEPLVDEEIAIQMYKSLDEIKHTKNREILN